MSASIRQDVGRGKSQFKKKYGKYQTIQKDKKKTMASKKYKGYFGNKSEGQGFADKRKKKMFYEYQKLKQKEKQTANFFKNRKLQEELGDISGENQKSEKKETVKMGAVEKAEKEFNRKKKSKLKAKQEALKREAERQEHLDKYRKTKQDRHKKLCKKNYKGQPVMANHMDLLLQKLQSQNKSYSKNSSII